MNRLLLVALGGLLMVPAAMAQNVTVDGNGNVKVDAGDGTRVDVDGTGRGNVNVQTHGRPATSGTNVQLRSGTSVQNISSNTGERRVEGNNVQRANIRGSRVNIATGGGTAISTIGGATSTATSARAGTVISGVGYINGDLDGSNFSGRNLTGVAFTNASLNEAKFANSILIGADFTNAELNEADLRGANLRNARIINAEFDGARLDGAVWVDGRKCGKNSIGRCR